MPRKHTLREKIEQRIARKKGEDVFLTANLRRSAARIRSCAPYVSSWMMARWCGSATASTDARRFRASTANRCSIAEWLRRRCTSGARQAGREMGANRGRTRLKEGRSTQVPVNPVVRVKGRFSRQLRYRNAELVLER